MKTKVTQRLLFAFKGGYLDLLPETSFKISHANCILNTHSTFFFDVTYSKVSRNGLTPNQVLIQYNRYDKLVRERLFWNFF